MPWHAVGDDKGKTQPLPGGEAAPGSLDSSSQEKTLYQGALVLREDKLFKIRRIASNCGRGREHKKKEKLLGGENNIPASSHIPEKKHSQRAQRS